MSTNAHDFDSAPDFFRAFCLVSISHDPEPGAGTGNEYPSRQEIMPSQNVFLTGSTGFVGGAVARALVARGHRVRALIRPTSMHKHPAGVVACPGDLREPGSWITIAQDSDVFVHAAYEYDASGREAPEADLAAESVITELLGRGIRAIYTSNAFLLDDPACNRLDETAELPPELRARFDRLQRERIVLVAGGAAVRLGAVYGGGGGTMSMLLDALATWPGFDDFDRLTNRWSVVHIEDLAALYCTIVEQHATGVFHGVDGTPLMASTIVHAARSALRAFPAQVDDVTAQTARTLLRKHRDVLERDIALRTDRAFQQLGWTPRFESYHAGIGHAVRDWHLLRSLQPRTQYV